MTHPAILRASQATGLSVDTIMSRSRKPDVCRARWAIMAELRARGLSLAAIGRLLKRDHSTVLHGLRAHEYLRSIVA